MRRWRHGYFKNLQLNINVYVTHVFDLSGTRASRPRSTSEPFNISGYLIRVKALEASGHSPHGSDFLDMRNADGNSSLLWVAFLRQ